MDILGIGPLEILFILVIALIVLGPNDMVKAGRTIGRFMRRIVTSPTWRTLQDASKELRSLPTRMIREAGLEELDKELPKMKEIQEELQVDQLKKDLEGDVKKAHQDLTAWTTSPDTPPSEAPVETGGNHNAAPEPQKNPEQE